MSSYDWPSYPDPDLGHLAAWYRMFKSRQHCRLFCASAALRIQNHYEVLGVSVNATTNQIKKQFFELSKRYHPDRNTDADPERYQQITAAYTVLSSEADRKKFDESLGTAVRRPQGFHSGRSWTHSGDNRTAHQRRPGTSGYSYNFKSMKAHKARSSANLDPLKPQSQKSSVPHFNFQKHAENHHRYEEYRKAKQTQERAEIKSSGAFRTSAATASMGSGDKSNPSAEGASFFFKACGATATGLCMMYLLLR